MCRVVTDVTNDHIDKVCVISMSAEITVGYTVTDRTVSESDGKAQLTVVVTMPTGADPIETFFSLIVNTSYGTATGLPWSLEFDHVPIHSSHKSYLSLSKVAQCYECTNYLSTICSSQ